MIAIVVPEPAPWVDEVVRAAGDRARVLAPPAPLRLGLRAWARGRADRIIRARLALRRAFDAWVALQLARLPALSAVVAPTGAARRTFAAAERLGARRVLVADQPCLRQLHRDLDRAARALPDRRFLRRYRADHASLVRQEAEWVLASAILVRGTYAHSIHAAAGVAPARLLALPQALPPAPATHRPGSAILLAGLAAARNGADAALAACADRWRLRVRAGEGAEPADLLRLPGVTPARGLDDIAAVIAPAWCESYPPELALAASLGLPIIATRAAAAFTSALEIPAGDAPALAAAIAHALASPRPPPTSTLAADRAALTRLLA